MPVTISIRAVPDDVRDELAARAARSGRSLQEYLNLELRRLASRPSAAEAMLRARLGARSFPDLGVDEVLEAVHAERR